MNEARCRGLSAGQINRRSMLKTTVMAGTAGLSLADILHGRAHAAAGAQEKKTAKKDTAVIQIWLGGGPTHFETYDPKPHAPQEYRGPFEAIDTNVPGTQVCELLPRHAKVMDKLTLMRGAYHNSSGHDVGMYYCTTGKRQKNEPSTGSITAKVRGAGAFGVPPYVHLGFHQTANLVFVPNFKAHYLGGSYDPFYTTSDPSAKGFKVPNLSLVKGVSLDRLDHRKTLLAGFDRLRREADGSGAIESIDHFQQSAFEMITGPRAREAFDLSREDPKLRDRYGRHRWGQSALLARRLVEAGVTFVTVNTDPHSYTFDMHSNVARGMKSAGPRLDSMLPTLVEDLYDRGLDKKVMIIVWGEFGRTPRINANAGRDHWGNVMSVAVAGGGLRMGQVIGSSNAKGEVPQDRPIKPEDILATMYRHLGIDPNMPFANLAGRPIPILYEGSVIPELV